MTQKFQNLIDNTDSVDEEIEELEDYDKIGQHFDLINHFVMFKRTSTPQLSTGPAITNVKLSKLELPTFWGVYKVWTFFFDQYNGAMTSRDSQCHKVFDFSPNHRHKL